MTETKKLREAFESRMTDNGKWPRAVEQGRNGCYLLAQTENAWAEWQACAEALALPTAVPVGEHEAFERTMMDKYGWQRNDFKLDDFGYFDGQTDTAWMAWQALSAQAVPDKVDAQRYRWLRDNGVLGFSGAPSWRVSVSFDAMDAYAQTLDSNIDAAMLAAK